MALNNATEYYFVRVNQGDILQETLNERLQEMPFFETAVLCSELGKRRYRQHFHILVKFTQPVIIQRTDWQALIGDSAWAIARNPNSPQREDEYVNNVLHYIQKDGDWWEL